MSQTPAETQILAHGPTIESTREFWRTHLRADKRPRTITTYLAALDRLDRFLAERGMPRTLAGIRREHLEEWQADMRERGLAPASISLYFRALRPFFNWLVEEDEIKVSPMAKMKTPRLELDPPPVLTADQLDRLFATVKGMDFESRRDNAILRLFYDSGVRRGELAGLTLRDVDLDMDLAHVEAFTSKSRRGRAVPFGMGAKKALMRYLRDPRAPSHAGSPLWVGRTGTPLHGNSILQMVRRRGRQAGIDRLYPHMLRHSWAHAMLASGHSEGDTMVLGGWKDRSMLDRYGASAASDRARAAYRSPGDELGRRPIR